MYQLIALSREILIYDNCETLLTTCDTTNLAFASGTNGVCEHANSRQCMGQNANPNTGEQYVT